ncbi:hypothetical protein BKP45_15905 [Anaerobacillus alkalidiazotrophicus]|uniref:DUF4183 domain-containing protein n=1 Tax=Anaerobacillus alkalidiazotrophicus TaxID=472963 RepID=A0A1S2M552_9BACI|nr:DUF4183 domain-containing protein [Anaerobacillus alkalidiazotrophicus]OIJ18765.1 hypothetical protein BKP45_15905 [Anaerobacillus alkalidiazotrophicus]
MPLRIMKLYVSATTETDVAPDVTRFFYETEANITNTTLSIDAADFEDDTGAAATALPELATDNSYYNVYINGVLQMEGISSYTAGATATGKLEITVGENETIPTGTPIVLEVTNFAPDSETTVTT